MENASVRRHFRAECPATAAMTESKSSEELYNEQRRQRAAELIAAIVRKRRRVDTDEALLDHEALRATIERVKTPRKQA